MRSARLLVTRMPQGRSWEFGTKYEIRFPMTGPRGKNIILSVWMIPMGESVPRLVTAYVE